ncbi:MAG: penicillin-binding protein 1C [Candidatus Velthaea sp.]
MLVPAMRTWAPLGVLLFALGVLLHPLHLEPGAGVTALTFTDRNGVTLGTVLTRDGERTVRVPLERVSPAFLRAIVTAEDARYSAHDGVDGAALLRACVQFARTGHVVSGGSTITMQLARLTRGFPRSPAGKAAEMVLALRIDAGTSKHAVLEEYVNRLPMGGNLAGIEAGARAYFGVPASDLDLAQAAFLAAIPNDPVRLNPYAHRAALEIRRRAILERLVAQGVAGVAEASHARDERLHPLPPSSGIYAAPHLLFRLSAEAAGDTRTIHTTLDGDLQRYVEAQTASTVAALRGRNVHDAAAIVLDNRTGEVLAYAGSPDFFAARGGRNDGVTALRQPGSTLKPFLYELAFERRAVRPTTILADVPAAYALPGRRTYAPADYNERWAGPVRARVALASSLNVPAVRVLSALGVDPFLERLRALGFRHLTRSAQTYGLGLTLGSGEVTLEEIALAYATAARGGRPPRMHAVASEADSAHEAAVGDPAAWALVTDMLADRHARARAFGVDSLLRLPFASAVKTGTSSDFRDTWTAGYTRDYTVATWAGNFDGSPMRRVSGVTGAAPLWNHIMRRLHATRDPAPFTLPAGYARTPMCAATGLRPSGACAAVVSELLDAGDRRALARRAPPLGTEYDAWLAQQPDDAAEGLRIVSPRDGARFVFAPGSRVALDARGSRGFVQWTLNGRPLTVRDARWLWPLQRGRWSFAATSAGQRATVTFQVGDAPPRRSARGFTLEAVRSKSLHRT